MRQQFYTHKAQRVLAGVLLLLSCCLLALPATAGEKFELQSHVRHLGDELGSVTIWTLSTVEGRYSFSAPAGWRIRPQAGEKTVLITSPDDQSILRIQIGKPFADASSKALAETVRKRFPAATVVEEFTCYSGVGDGTAFELKVAGTHSTTMMRVAFLALGEAGVTFTLQSPGDQADRARYVFADILMSFERAKSSSASAR